MRKSCFWGAFEPHAAPAQPPPNSEFGGGAICLSYNDRIPPRPISNITRAKAYQLRHEQTPAEAKLWQALRTHRLGDIHFRRQHPIGGFIVDFCTPKHRLIIELDGSPHLGQREYDAERTAFLETRGYRVLRFWNSEVINDLDSVILKILEALGRNLRT